VKLHSLSLVDKDGQPKKIDFAECENKKSIFSELSEEDQDKIRGVLFIMDRFCVSDAAYHEFSMSVHGMERSYLVRQCRSDLNKLIHITRTPGNQPGVQMSFKEELNYQLKKVSPKLFAYIYLELHALPHELKMECARCAQVCYFTRRTLDNVLLRGLCLAGKTKLLLIPLRCEISQAFVVKI
jgi:hypothetical protein